MTFMSESINQAFSHSYAFSLNKNRLNCVYGQKCNIRLPRRVHTLVLLQAGSSLVSSGL